MLNAAKIAVTLTLACCALTLGSCAQPTAQSPPPVTTVYYFYRTIRCPSCEKIEALTKRTVEQRFARELASGRMVWRTVNIDESANAHFEQDYRLQAQSVVLSKHRGAAETRWKNLDKVWDLLDDDAGFLRYVQDEIRAYIQGT
jgi:hypothetical protein